MGQYLGLFTSILLFLVASGNGLNNDPCSNVDADSFLEDLLQKSRVKIPDPIRLPTMRKYNLKMSEGQMWGLSKVQSVGPAKVDCYNRTIFISSHFNVNKLKGRYEWEREGYLYSTNGIAFAMASNVHIDIKLSQELRDKAHPELITFKLRNMEDIKVEFTGLGLVSWLFSWLTTMTSFIFKSQITSIVEGPMAEAITIELLQVTLPIL